MKPDDRSADTCVPLSERIGYVADALGQCVLRLDEILLPLEPRDIPPDARAELRRVITLAERLTDETSPFTKWLP